MKRDSNIFNYGHAVRQQEIIEKKVIRDYENKEVQESHDVNDAFLRIVYAIDKLTKLPTGDLSYMVSDKANPEIKKWVLDNLMVDALAAALPSAPKGLSDDDIASLSKDPKEDQSEEETFFFCPKLCLRVFAIRP